MINTYIEDQKEVTTLLLNALNNNKLVQAYMFCSKDTDFLLKYAKDFSKDLICKNVTEKQKDKIIKKIDKNEYEELVILEPINGLIKKEQIVKLKEILSTKPIEGARKVYIMQHCDKLNIVSANSMLKFIEDADENIVAIFLTDNLDSVIPTIKSRCQVLIFNNYKTEKKYNFLDNEYQERENIEELLEISYNFLEYFTKNNINSYYKLKDLIYDKLITKEDITIFLSTILYFYYDSFNYKLMNKMKYFNNISNLAFHSLIEQISEEKIEKIVAYILIVEKIKVDFSYNLNHKLVFDRLILELGEV